MTSLNIWLPSSQTLENKQGKYPNESDPRRDKSKAVIEKIGSRHVMVNFHSSLYNNIYMIEWPKHQKHFIWYHLFVVDKVSHEFLKRLSILSVQKI